MIRNRTYFNPQILFCQLYFYIFSDILFMKATNHSQCRFAHVGGGL
ncbi:hypothetical protein BRYFOR_06995 [Marvinbryantia formatexigens DSM 14469]|uniref:Uncharacterized protein n=1 Tax=Marvinbryantia formatexigens DSM 14469 TaxID=478749 RepID=C6LEE6_9FIRM|nr:hypothetical protein BRYFOR_06995 [Marvinbryantia formatexigens DSM 14469]